MKINTASIEGYAEMTAEQKIAALEAFEVQEQNSDESEVTKLKNLLSKANSEAAGYKKQLREKMTADEQAEADRKAAEDALRQELSELKRSSAVSGYKAKFLALGYDETTAGANAEAMLDGNFDALFSAHSALNETMKKKAVADAMAGQKPLTSGAPAATRKYTAEEIASMSVDEINANWDAINESLKTK